MTKKEAIKFLQQIYPNGGHCWLDEQRMEAINMAIDALRDKLVSDDLEEEASIYQASHPYSKPYKSFKEGAKWVIRQMPKVQREEYYKNGFQKGKRAMKRQLMKDAVECDVLADKDGFYTTETWDKMNNLLHKINAKNGDKVNLVIIKD